MSNTKNLSILLVIIGLISSAGAAYYFTSNQYKPVILELEENLETATTSNIHLNSTLNKVFTVSANQNTTLSELTDEVTSLQEFITGLELELESLNENINATNSELIRYKNISKEFYKVNPIRIGLTAASDYDVSFIEDLAEKAEQEIHTYCINNDLPYRFEFVIGSNLGLDDMALTNTLTYDTLGINLVIGHGWDSQCSAALNYVNNNDMILLSYGSSSNELAQKDNLYRLTPNDTMQFQVNLACMKELDIEHVVVFADRSDWGKGMSQMAVDELSENQIDATTISFSVDPNRDILPNLIKLSDLLYNLTSRYGKEHIAVQMFGYFKYPVFGHLVPSNVFSVLWFGTSNTIYSDFRSWEGKAGAVALLSPTPVTGSERYIEFRDEVVDNYGFEASYYGVSAYDACWLYALSIIDSGSTDTEAIKEALMDVSKDYVGVSGSCSLNIFGDRISSDYSIMGYAGDGEFLEFGSYNYVNQTVEFTRIHSKLPS